MKRVTPRLGRTRGGKIAAGLLGALAICSSTSAAQPSTKTPANPTAPGGDEKVTQSGRPAASAQAAETARSPAPPIYISLKAPDAAPKREWLAPLITGIFSFLSSMLVLVAALGNTDKTVKANLKATEGLIHQKANEAELLSLQARLGDFYGPYLQRSEENLLLVQELRSRQSDPNFRTLTALQDAQWKRRLSKADRTLVTEIVANGDALRELIQTKAGLADPALQEHFARAATHFRLLSLAQAGALGDPERFARYVYPRELDGALKAAIAHLEARAKELRSDPSRPHGPLKPLNLPEDCRLPPWPDPRVRQI